MTFLFTDIEGSTRIFRRLGDRYETALAVHHALIRSALADHDGHEVSTEGDAFFAAFAEADDAIAACGTAQRALQSEPWPNGAEIRVRMGIHTGLAYPREGDYVAYAVHQAARVVGAAHGNQAIATAETVRRAASPVGDIDARSLGSYRVRDFDEPVELFQLEGPGLRTDFPALRVLPADRHNLVRPTTLLFGRERELEELSRLVADHRLVTLAGPGGIGKTRLIVEQGLQAADRWPDGVWFVDLSSVDHPSRLGPALSVAVGAPTAPDPVEAAVEHLREREALLLLDNCEHLVVAIADLVEDLLGRCPAVRILATSREPLGLRSEHVWRIPALAPDGPAAELFAQRSGLGAEGSAVRQLCEMLDGLPLAIELAAARADAIPPAEMVLQLRQRPSLLRSRDPSLAPRQRNVTELVDWSVQLLDEREQSVYIALGGFGGSFDLDTAAAAASAVGVDPDDAVDAVWSLASKSLVATDPAAGATRYRLLETIRADARRRLGERSMTQAVADSIGRHLEARFGAVGLGGADRYDAADLAEVSNIRAALADLSPSDPVLAQHLARSLLAAGGTADYPLALAIDEVARLSELFDQPTPALVSLLARLAKFAADAGRHSEAETFLSRAERLIHEVGEPDDDELIVTFARAVALVAKGRPAEGLELATADLPRATTPLGRSRMRNLLTLAYAELGRLDDARTSGEAGVALDEERDVAHAVAHDHGMLAEIALRAGDRVDAARHQLDSLEIALQLGDELNIACATIVAARLLDGLDWPMLTYLHGHADASLERIGHALYATDRALRDQLLVAARAELGDDAFEAAYRSGVEAALVEVIDRTRTTLRSCAADAPAPRQPQ